MRETDHSSQGAQRSALIIRLATLWVLAGALYKLFEGSPNDLPPMVQEFFLGPVQTFRFAIAAELCIVLLAILAPRFGWAPLCALFAVFMGVLTPLVTSGVESCGCFGSSITIRPIVMLGIDGSLLIAVLATRPWSALAAQKTKSVRIALLVPLCALSIAAPWIKFKTVDLEDPPTGGAGEQPLADIDFHWFNPEEWLEQMIFETELQYFLDVEMLPDTCHVLFYRQQCDHCKEHLETLATGTPAEEPLVLIRVPEEGDDDSTELTTLKPDWALLMELKALAHGYGGIETPATMDLEGFVVKRYESLQED